MADPIAKRLRSSSKANTKNHVSQKPEPDPDGTNIKREKKEAEDVNSSLAASIIPAPSLPIFEIKELFQTILAHLPPTALPNSRLVSQQWNSNAVEVMKRKGWMIRTVGTHGILEYIWQVKASVAPQVESQLNLSVSLGVEKPLTQRHISRGLSAMIKLTTLCGGGRNSIQSFRFTCPMNWEKRWNEMMGSLVHIAPGLKKLTIEELRFTFVECSHPEPVPPPADFPQLQEFTYYLFEGRAEMLRDIVNGSQKLEKLKIQFGYKTEHGSVNHNCDSQLSVIYSALSEFTSAFAHLKELSIPLSKPEHNIALQRLHFPLLAKLRLSFLKLIEGEESNEQALATFLAENCPQLASLEFVLDGIHNVSAIFPGGLPQLPNLTHFGYFIEHFRLPVFANADNLNPAQFSNVTSATVYFGHFLYSRNQIWDVGSDDDSEEEEVDDIEEEEDEDDEDEVEDDDDNSDEDEENNPFHQFHQVHLRNPRPAADDWRNWPATQLTFNSVDRLHLMIDQCWEPGLGGGSHHEFFQDLRALFPAIRELIVELQIEALHQDQNSPKVERVLQELLGGKIGGRIEQLEIRNYYCDWLNVLLRNSSAVRARLRGLKSLSLPPVAAEYKNSIDPSIVPERSKGELSVPTLMAHLPGLEKLKVHNLFLRAKKGAAANRDIQEIIGEFQLAYPGLSIELL